MQFGAGDPRFIVEECCRIPESNPRANKRMTLCTRLPLTGTEAQALATHNLCLLPPGIHQMEYLLAIHNP
eukprot:6474156-Amphidinium_carterae.2